MEIQNIVFPEVRLKNAHRIKDIGTRWTKMRRNFELFDDEGGVFKIPALSSERLRLLSSARPFLFLLCGDGKKKDELKILFSIYFKKDSLTRYYDFPCDSTNLLYDQNLSTNNLELVNPNIILYPNPSIDFITIKNLSNYALSHIVIRDLNGKIVYSKKVNSKQINIDVSFLQKGAYFADCIIEGTRKRLKLIKL